MLHACTFHHRVAGNPINNTITHVSIPGRHMCACACHDGGSKGAPMTHADCAGGTGPDDAAAPVSRGGEPGTGGRS
eukprot:11755893-Alexandrium_andersonii.AAC.1